MELQPVDHYFEDVLPNYSSECRALASALTLTFLFWVVVFPYAANKIFFDPASNEKHPAVRAAAAAAADADAAVDGEETTAASTAATNKTVSTGSAKQRRGKSNKKSLPSADKKESRKSPSLPKDDVPPEAPAVPLFVLAIASLGCMVSLFWVTMTLSPYNTFVARGVFEVPMFTAQECEKLLNISFGVAERNMEEARKAKEMAELSGAPVNKTIEGLLWEPAGWQKHRHGAYPTTDLNIITDPFTRSDLDWLQEKLDARLAPTLSRIYGIPESAIRANDMFVVRYDSEYRAHLSNHTDDADISFNILLTDNFEGGGTRFWSRQTGKPFAHVQPKRVGQMLTHSALINHEGMPTTQGTRVIFVGFLSVDRIDPFSEEANSKIKLNTFQSYLSLPWISTKFKEAYSSAHHRRGLGIENWRNNKYAMALFLDLANILQLVGDYFSPHHVQKLVSDENAEQHLRALDELYLAKKITGVQDENEKASWFAGQQIDLDIDGTVTNEWSTRRNSKNRFMEL